MDSIIHQCNSFGKHEERLDVKSSATVALQTTNGRVMRPFEHD
jgi:hypothetical protein